MNILKQKLFLSPKRKNFKKYIIIEKEEKEKKKIIYHIKHLEGEHKIENRASNQRQP